MFERTQQIAARLWWAALAATQPRSAEIAEPANGPRRGADYGQTETGGHRTALDAARAALTEVSQRVGTDRTWSHLIWCDGCVGEWEASRGFSDPIAAVEAYLRTGQARAWQLEH